MSISSRDLALVSGMKKRIKSPPTAHQAQKKMYVPQEIESSVGGVKKATMKLFIQFDDALM
jgi:hypothetical protein